MSNLLWLFSKRDSSDYVKTTYTTVVNPSDASCKLFIPATVNYSKLIVYIHGSSGDVDSPVNLGNSAAEVDLTNRWFAEGWCILSHTAQGNNWGNTAAYNNYIAALAWATTYAAFTETVIYSLSMGGLCGLKLFINTPSIVKWVGVYPVTNLANMFAGSFKAAIKTAYGFTLDADYATATAGCDPNLFSASAFLGKKMLFTSSYADGIVSRINNTNLMATKVTGQAAVLSSLDGMGDHGDATHFLWASINNFIKS